MVTRYAKCGPFLLLTFAALLLPLSASAQVLAVSSTSVSAEAVIWNNILRRNAANGIFISTSKNVETYSNTLESNFRAIEYLLKCSAVGGCSIGYDLANNNTYDNAIRVDSTSGAFANAFAYLSSRTSTQHSPYLNCSKNLTFQANHYTLPSTGRYWVWGLAGLKYWSE